MHGFPVQFFSADYILIANPVQIKLPGQLVVTFLSELVFSDPPNLELMESYRYHIDGDIEVRLYRRIGPFTDEIIKDLQNRMYEIYPDQENLFNFYSDKRD